VGKLSSLFNKARSMLELPLMRLSQAKSGQLEKVSHYYSTALLAFARRVLQVSPTHSSARVYHSFESQNRHTFAQRPRHQ
jgi:hypothetical protein